MIILASIVCGLAAVLMLFMLGNYVSRYHIDLFYSLRFYSEKERPPYSFMEYKAVKWVVALVQRLAARLPQTQFLENLNPKIRRAGIPMLASEFIVAVLLTSAAVGFIIFSMTLDLTLALIFAYLVITLGTISISVLTNRRREKFVNQLGDCLTTVSNALRAGYSFLQAMDLVSREMEPPISEEFAHVMRDVSYGMNLEQALLDMDKRVGSPDFELVVTAVLIQQEVGGNLAQVLDTISDTINDRIRMRREIMTLTTQSKMSSWILSGLPIVIVLGQLLIDSNHFDATLNNPFGLFLIVTAVIMEIIGFIIIRRIANIKVE